jgi:UDP-2,3-diacylglucosamine pyrophosphatase LpxH
MIAVISDLHFEEEASDVIHGADGRDLVFRRNLDARAYVHFIAQMADEVTRRDLSDFDLVIAGDLFDFSRTTLWFEDEVRPYVPLDETSPALEAKLLRILEATAAEPPVARALDAFRLLARGRYCVPEDRADGGKERDFPAQNIRVHILAGNHDRACNATPQVRRRIRELVGLGGDAPFGHTLLFDDPGALIRHGHEYDRNNFGLDPEKLKTIPTEIPEKAYSAPTFGDFVTIDIAARLPWLLRRKYGDEAILHDDVLASLYLRLLQFDDVRPQSALLDYLLDTSTRAFDPEDAWERLVPIIELLLDQIHNDPFFRKCLSEQARPWAPAELEGARALLKTGGWKNRVSREISRKVAHYFLGGETERPELVAQREELLQKQEVRLVVAGHTHTPEVCLIGSDRGGDRFYINTGTWRYRIPSSADRRTFGRLQALTYVMLFGRDEDPKDGAERVGSFDYWTGYTRHWLREAEDSERGK